MGEPRMGRDAAVPAGVPGPAADAMGPDMRGRILAGEDAEATAQPGRARERTDGDGRMPRGRES